MKIYRQEHSEIYNKFSKLLRQETVAIKKYDNITSYFVAEIDEEMVGVVGWQQMKNGHFRLKTDYVLAEYRGKKIYSNLWDKRINVILSYGATKLSAYCTNMSLPKYLKEGFRIMSVNNRGVKYVVKKI
jgi:N-acetylglutamate synthase-like GNAT family acetyltransferase